MLLIAMLAAAAHDSPSADWAKRVLAVCNESCDALGFDKSITHATQ